MAKVENFLLNFYRTKERFFGPTILSFGNKVVLVSRISPKSTPSFKIYRNRKMVLDLGSFIPPNIRMELSPFKKWTVRRLDSGQNLFFVWKIKSRWDLMIFLKKIGDLSFSALSDLINLKQNLYEEEVIKDPKNLWPESRFSALACKMEVFLAREKESWIFALERAWSLEMNLLIRIVDQKIQAKIEKEKSVTEKDYYKELGGYYKPEFLRTLAKQSFE